MTRHEGMPKWRQSLQHIEEHIAFRAGVLLLIVANSIMLAAWDPLDDHNSFRNQGMEIADIVFNSLFTVEMVIKIGALNLFCGPTAYLRDGWNVMDGTLVILGWVAMLLLVNSSVDLGSFKVVRSLRTLRALRIVPGLNTLINALNRAAPQLLNVGVLCGFMFSLFGLIGVTLFNGKLRQRCLFLPELVEPFEQDLLDGRYCSTNPSYGRQCDMAGTECGVWNGKFAANSTLSSVDDVGQITNFDNIFSAWLTIFVVITLEGWSDMMYALSDTALGGIVQLFFFALIMIGALVCLNLVVAIVTISYSAVTLEERQEEARELEEEETKVQLLQEEATQKGNDNENNATNNAINSDENDLEKPIVVATVPSNVSGGSVRICRRSSAASTIYFPTRIATMASNSPIIETLRCWGQKFTRFCQWLVGRRWFDGLVFWLIVINTCLLAAEHYDQPQALTDFNSVANVVLTLLFSFEVIVRMRASGVRKYFNDSFNCFDFIVVAVSLVELIVAAVSFQSGGGGAISALRAARLLRVVRLARSWETLNRLLITVAHTLRLVAPFGILLFLFIFIYAITGMFFFGGALVIDPSSESFDCDPRTSPHFPHCAPRANFDSFLWAFVTTFQIITGEDWNQVMYSLIEEVSWVSLLFPISAVLVGSFIVLNLFLAILIDNFLQMTRQLNKDGVIRECTTMPSSDSRSVSTRNEEVQECLDTQKRACSKRSSPTRISSGYADVESNDNSHTDFLMPVSSTKRRDVTDTSLSSNHTVDEKEVTERRRNSSINRKSEGELSEDTINPNIEEENEHNVHKGAIEMALEAAFGTGGGTPARDHRGSVESITSVSSTKPHPHDIFAFNSPPRVHAKPTGQVAVGVMLNPTDSNSSSVSLETELGLKRNLSRSGGGRPEQQQQKLMRPSLRQLKSTGFYSGDSFEKASNTSEILRVVEKQIKLRRRVSFTEHSSYKSRSLFCLLPDNRLRKFCAKVAFHPWFEKVVLLVIFVSCLLLALDEPTAPQNRLDVLERINLVIVALFVIEAIAKIISMGFVAHRGSYLRDTWNVLDFFLVVLACVAILMPSLGAVRSLRVVRSLRPLRVIRRVEGLKIVVISLSKAVFPVLQVALGCFLFFLICAILGVTFFGGQFRSCHMCPNGISEGDDLCVNPSPFTCKLSDSYEVDNCTDISQMCISDPNLFNVTWSNPRYNANAVSTPYHFDDVVRGLLTLYEVSSLELWLEVMHTATDVVGYGQAPVRGSNDYAALFFVLFVLFSHFFILQLFVAVVVETFQETQDEVKGSAFMSEAQSEWVELQRSGAKLSLRPIILRPVASKNPIRHYCYRLINHRFFDNTILVIIVLNTILLSTQHYDSPEELDSFVYYADFLFAAVYAAEALVKIIALRRTYFAEKSNVLDFFVVLAALTGIVLEAVPSMAFGGVGTDLTTAIETLRVLRVTRLLKFVPGLNTLFRTMALSLPAMGNICLLFSVVLFMYAALGMSLFGDARQETLNLQFLNDYANFETFWMSVLLLFRMSTGESWNGIMHDLEVNSPVLAPLFCVSYVVIIMFIMINIFVAVILSDLEQVFHEEAMRINDANGSGASIHELLDDYAEAWALCRVALENADHGKHVKHPWNDRKHLPVRFLPFLLRSLSPPFGVKNTPEEYNPAYMMRLIAALKVPVTDKGAIHYHTTLYTVIDFKHRDQLANTENASALRGMLHARMSSRGVLYRTQVMDLAQENTNAAEMIALQKLRPVLLRFLQIAREKRANRLLQEASECVENEPEREDVEEQGKRRQDVKPGFGSRMGSKISLLGSKFRPGRSRRGSSIISSGVGGDTGEESVVPVLQQNQLTGVVSPLSDSDSNSRCMGEFVDTDTELEEGEDEDESDYVDDYADDGDGVVSSV